MKYNIYSLLDNKVKAYGMPFYSMDNTSAVEACRHFVNDEQCPISDNLVDYNLFCVGSFDDFTGTLIPLSSPEHIIPLIQLKESKDA